MTKIKVFITKNLTDKNDAEILNTQIEEWEKGFTGGVEIVNVHSNSNKFGWMIVITYKAL